jgi:phosphonate transport system permease protein
MTSVEMTSGIDTIHESYLSDRRISRIVKFIILLLTLTFGVWTVDVLNIPIERVLRMFGPLASMVTDRLMPPDLYYVVEPLILASIFETIQMSVLGVLGGLLIAIPMAWFGAWNVTPNRTFLYPLGRAVIVIARAIPTLMWAILLVAVFGFGPFAGTLALIKSTIGFAGKLMADQIEAIDMESVFAVRATGANEIQVFVYGILPQVKPAWVGISIYSWDSGFRGSTILGYVGAGGMGLYLREQISVMEYHTAMGIIVAIIGLVILSETLSHYLRHRLY